MGTAKILKKSSSKTNSIIGTPHYMAPEVLNNKGYSFYVDLWSLGTTPCLSLLIFPGICLFEFMCGMVPFGEEAEDPFSIYEEVIMGDLKFPSYHQDKKAQKLIRQLLNSTPEARHKGSYAQLKANKWFSADDFDFVLSPLTPLTRLIPLTFSRISSYKTSSSRHSLLQTMTTQISSAKVIKAACPRFRSRCKITRRPLCIRSANGRRMN